MSFVKKLVSTFGVGFEFGTSTSQQCISTGSESLARRAHATAQDPMFQKLKEQFTADFDFRLVYIDPRRYTLLKSSYQLSVYAV